MGRPPLQSATAATTVAHKSVCVWRKCCGGVSSSTMHHESVVSDGGFLAPPTTDDSPCMGTGTCRGTAVAQPCMRGSYNVPEEAHDLAVSQRKLFSGARAASCTYRGAAPAALVRASPAAGPDTRTRGQTANERMAVQSFSSAVYPLCRLTGSQVALFFSCTRRKNRPSRQCKAVSFLSRGR